MKKTVPQPTIRRRHSQQFKDEALALAERVGVSVAARQLGLNENMLYTWRSSKQAKTEQGTVEQSLAAENALLQCS